MPFNVPDSIIRMRTSCDTEFVGFDENSVPGTEELTIDLWADFAFTLAAPIFPVTISSLAAKEVFKVAATGITSIAGLAILAGAFNAFTLELTAGMIGWTAIVIPIFNGVEFIEPLGISDAELYAQVTTAKITARYLTGSATTLPFPFNPPFTLPNTTYSWG